MATGPIFQSMCREIVSSVQVGRVIPSAYPAAVVTTIYKLTEINYARGHLFYYTSGAFNQTLLFV